MKLMLAQTNPAWGDAKANLKALKSLCKLATNAQVDLLVLPELALTGYNIFDRLDSLAESEDGPISNQVAKFASEYKLHILFGLAQRQSDEILTNSAVLFDDTGKRLTTYHKRQLWDRENDYFTAGKEGCVIDTHLGRLGLMICYDNEFPEIARELAQAGAQIILSPTANMLPNADRQILQVRARAMDNQCFVACVNRSGVEGALHYCGHSLVAGPDGEVLGSLGRDSGVLIVDIDLNRIQESRSHQDYLTDLQKLNGADL